MKFPIALLCLITGLFWSLAQAAQLPSYYPAAGFQHTGNVDRVNFQSREVVIGDSLFVLSEDAVLHSLSSPSDSLGRLIKGTRVGIRYVRQGNRRVIEDVWLLPSSWQPSRKSLDLIDGPIDTGQ